MSNAKLTLQVITQEQHVLTDIVDCVTAPTVEGEVTILPHHISLFTKLDAGEVVYKKSTKDTRYVISGGFMEVSGGKTVTILADSAINSEKINVAKAEAAMKRAQQLLKEKTSRRELILAEADLRRALMELKVARRKKSV